MDKEDKFRNISTKVKPEFYGYYITWCNDHDTTVYDQTQLLLEGFLAYASGTFNLSDEIQQLRYTFESQPGWKNMFNLCDHQTEPQVYEAVYFIGDEKKNSLRPMLVKIPFMGQWTQTMSIPSIIERVFENSNNALYRDLRLVGAELGTNSVLETIQKLVISYKQHADADELDKMFADNDRSEFGVKPKTDGPYVRKLKRTAEIEKEKLDKVKADVAQQKLDWEPLGGEW